MYGRKREVLDSPFIDDLHLVCEVQCAAVFLEEKTAQKVEKTACGFLFTVDKSRFVGAQVKMVLGCQKP